MSFIWRDEGGSIPWHIGTAKMGPVHSKVLRNQGLWRYRQSWPGDRMKSMSERPRSIKEREIQEKEEDRGDYSWFLPFCGPNFSLILKKFHRDNLSDVLSTRRILILSSLQLWIAFHIAPVPSTLVAYFPYSSPVLNSPNWEGFLLRTTYWTLCFHMVALKTQPSEKNITEGFLCLLLRKAQFILQWFLKVQSQSEHIPAHSSIFPIPPSKPALPCIVRFPPGP